VPAAAATNAKTARSGLIFSRALRGAWEAIMSGRCFVRRILSVTTLAAAMALMLSASNARAADPDEISAEAKAAFDKRMFTVEPAQKGRTYACFTRRYDARHLASHPAQTVKQMKLLVTAEWSDENKAQTYSFSLGVKFRNQRVGYDSLGGCSHATMGESKGEVRLGCGVDCDGGGLGIALVKEDESAVVRLERVRIWPHGKDRDDDSPGAIGELVAGKDDGMFRLDRASIDDCRSMVSDKDELAEMQQKN
jgi:hypothetical protein